MESCSATQINGSNVSGPMGISLVKPADQQTHFS